jgi:Peptidase family M28
MSCSINFGRASKKLATNATSAVILFTCLALNVANRASASGAPKNNSHGPHKHTSEVATINIRGLSLSELNTLKQNSAFKWWSEFGDTLVVGGLTRELRATHATFTGHWKSLDTKDLRIINAGHQNELPPSTITIARSGRTSLVVQNQALDAQAKGSGSDGSDHHMAINSFAANTTYVQSSDHDPQPSSWTTQQTSLAQAVMQDIDGARWYSDVSKLNEWNRHVSSPGVISARDWLKDQFDALHATSTVLQKFSVGSRDAWNVVTTFDAGPNSDVYIVGGHYDSISEQVSRAAPGAEDNATGAAGVLELARVFAARRNNATLIFVAFSGEEEGLLGSYAFVANSTPEFKARIKSVITMDMIGYSKDASTDVLLETASEFRTLSDQYVAAARLVEGLTSFTSFNPWGSDHMPFIENHIPAMLTIDNDWGDYPSYHRTTDTLDKVSRDMGVAILKMNAGVLAAMQGN